MPSMLLLLLACLPVVSVALVVTRGRECGRRGCSGRAAAEVRHLTTAAERHDRAA